jgi:hypothetical protein
MANWTGNEYAAMNLRTLKENIRAYTSYAERGIYSDVDDRLEDAVNAVQALIDAIEDDRK